jgi:hypothetical protein
MAEDNIAESYGNHHLKNFYIEEAKKLSITQ